MEKLLCFGEINHLLGHFCRSSRCAANDPKYSSPARVPTKKYLATRSFQPNQASETPLLRSHTKSKRDAPSSSKSKDSRSLLRHPPSSHRKILFSQKDIQNEDLPKTSAQTLDLKQNKAAFSTGSRGTEEVSRSQTNENHVNSKKFHNESIRSPPGTTQDTYTKANATEAVGIEEIFTDFKTAKREAGDWMNNY